MKNEDLLGRYGYYTVNPWRSAINSKGKGQGMSLSRDLQTNLAGAQGNTHNRKQYYKDCTICGGYKHILNCIRCPLSRWVVQCRQGHQFPETKLWAGTLLISRDTSIYKRPSSSEHAVA